MPKYVEGFEVCDAKLEKPFRIIVGGSSGSGKTTFLKKLVDRNHFSSPFDKIVYLYPDYLMESPVEFDQIVHYKPGLADLEYFTSLPQNTLIIYDDMMNECGNSKEIMQLFSVVARKRNLSIIFIVQNMFDQTKQFRNIKLNATGFVLFKFHTAIDVLKRSLRDVGVQKLLPNRLLETIYKQRYSYIFIDMHPNRHSEFGSVLSNIFDKNFSIYHKMEYVAIPKSEFLKHFTIQEAKEGSIRAIKDEIEVRKTSKRKRKRKSAKRRKYSSEISSGSTTATESTSE